ncbi:MAG: GntR family transcriptional regulator, partial [Gammaproteobacteria bacterium]
MDYTLLFDAFARAPEHAGWPRQRLLHGCLRAAIRDGTLAPGTRLVATRALAEAMGLARNTVLYAYEQLASEGLVVPDRRGTVVASLAVAPAPAPGPLAQAGLSSRARGLRDAATVGNDGQAFAPGVPALDAFPLALWRRLLERAWRGLAAHQLNYGDPAGEPQLRAAIAEHLRASRAVLCDASQVFITDGTQASLDV